MTVLPLRLVPLAATIAFVGLAGSALAYVCHPNGKGTLTKTVNGAVSSVVLHGRTAVYVSKEGGHCARVGWDTTTGAARSVPVSCAEFARTRRASSTGTPSASAGGFRLTVEPGAVGRPPLLQVLGRHGALLHTLALPATPRTFVASGGLAVFSAARGEGLFVVRLIDGLYTYLGPDGGSFQALLGPRGVLFHDGESRRAVREGKTILKFVPRRAIIHSIAKTAAPLVVGGPIHSISMDGPRVALSVGDVRSVCDRVLYWNVAWRPVQRISAPSGPTCRPGHTGVAIGRLAIGGFRTEWLTSERWLVAGSPLCQEWLVRRGGKVGAMAGNGAHARVRGRPHGRDRRRALSAAPDRFRPRGASGALSGYASRRDPLAGWQRRGTGSAGTAAGNDRCRGGRPPDCSRGEHARGIRA